MRPINCACVILLLVVGCDTIRNIPHAVSKTATLEIHIVSPTKTATAKLAVDPGSKAPIYLLTPPFISAADVESVQRSKDDAQSQALVVNLTPGGATKMTTMTGKSVGAQIAFVVNGAVVSTPTLTGPISKQFIITGTDAERLFLQLTQK